MDHQEKATLIGILNRILELELAGVVRYTHYALMVFGHSRIPIMSWLNENADESLAHARKAGEMITLLGGHPSLKIGQLLESEKHDINDILRECLTHEQQAVDSYHELLHASEGKSVLMEEYARGMIAEEEMHLDAINKMLRKPGDIEAFMA